MNCIICKKSIINTINLVTHKDKFLKLYRKLFPKKPIQLQYCCNCYEQIYNELEIEYNSQLEHNRIYDSPKPKLKEKDNLLDSPKDLKVTKLYELLDEKEEQYKTIAKHFNDTVPFEIIRIEKINNPTLEQNFDKRSKELSCQNIKWLFHGSSDKVYDSVLKTGFDIDFAAPTGILGKGIYFAEEASYSNSYGRMTTTNIGKINHLLYCKVNLGKTDEGHTGMTKPPQGFDGVHSNHKTYCVFDNYQGIPQYIIYYLTDTESKT